MRSLPIRILSGLLGLLPLAACGHTWVPTPVPNSLDELNTELGGWIWRGYSTKGVELSFMRDGTLRCRIVEVNELRVARKCPIPTDLLDDPKWTLSRFTSEQTNSVGCTLTVVPNNGQPSEYQLSWTTSDGPHDGLGLKQGDCKWSLLRGKGGTR